MPTPSKHHQMQALNIIIPIGGIGSRFSKEGYRYPKPLINIVGRPMILRLIDNLSLTKHDTLWMAVNEEIDNEFRIGQLIAKSFPEMDFKLLRLKHQTRGASETLYVTTQSMAEEHLERKTISLDCDTIYWADILQHVRDIPLNCGAVFYFPDFGVKPIYSYIKTSSNNSEEKVEYITDIQEKKAISNKANTGAYVFATGSLLRDWAAKNIDANASKHDGLEVAEYFTSQLIGMMILQGELPFLALELQKKDFSCVGTPEQLQDLLLHLKSDECENQVKKRRFCFDLDMTLVGVPAVAGDYSTCPPIWKNIVLVRELHGAGHHIIIQTARRMKTHKGNVGAILRDVGAVTLNQLATYEIPFDDLHLGKPWADIYIDDLAVNANLDTAREIGWLLDTPTSGLTLLCSDQRSVSSRGDNNKMVAARDFNTIQIIGDKVLKSSKNPNILGELFFYAHLPVALLPVFPTVFAVDYLEETQTYTIEMENRKGLTFSYLLVGRSITTGRLRTLLNGLHHIHTTPSTSTLRLPIAASLAEKFSEHSLERVDGRVNIYANYGTKLRSRYHSHITRYNALGPDAKECFNRLNEFLDTYEAEDKGVHTEIIHGDPVFSNVILSKDERTVSFIDVRCQLDNTLTMEGDIHYDLAKVLQSLLGYDHVLFMDPDSATLPEADQPLLEEADERVIKDLQDVFWKFLETKYEVTIHKKTLLRVTASLLFTLIPLHKEQLGPIFLRMCKETLQQASGIPFGNLSVSKRRTGVLGVGGMERRIVGSGGLREVSGNMRPVSASKPDKQRQASAGTSEAPIHMGLL